MAEVVRNAVAGGTALWNGLGPVQRVLLLVLAVLLPIAIVAGAQWATESSYVPLFASLGPDEAGAIITQLKATRTPYRMQGEQILVPAERAGEVRLRVASQGLPIGGGVGFEVFDRTNLGVSDFTQRLNYQRALQGELARTIAQLRGVERARVHLVLPQPSLFAERERPSTASVFLKLGPGSRLSGEQVRGIVHLVASSVEGLATERVTVIDTAGRVLLAGGDAGPGSALSPRRLELKTAVEEGLERRVQTLLDSVLGPGQAVTRVSAQINFDQIERTEERFDPNPIVRQESRTVESARGNSSAPIVGGAPPQPANAAPAPPPASTTNNDGTRESESTSYELSKVVARTLTAPGEIQRLSVAVLVNAPGRGAPRKEGEPARETTPRSPEELEKIRRVVMGAVGFSATRGDEVTVVEMPFEPPVPERERGDAADALPPGGMVQRLHPYGLAAAAAAVSVVVVMFLMRRRGRARALESVTRTLETSAGGGGRSGATMAAAAAAGGGGAVAGEEAEDHGIPEEFLRLGRERKGLRQRAVALASSEPETTAQLLRAWMVKRK
jgi:flagellar M-ring protein FliF